MTALPVVLAAGGGTYLLRVSMFVVLGARAIPPWAEPVLSLVAPAAVAALTASMLLTTEGELRPMPLAELIAVAAGFVAVRRTGQLMHAFVVGLPVLWVLTPLTT
jgi:branched-subunit amino acid transport protein